MVILKKSALPEGKMFLNLFHYKHHPPPPKSKNKNKPQQYYRCKYSTVKTHLTDTTTSIVTLVSMKQMPTFVYMYV